MSFRTALSGMNAASTDLEVTGHNIANSSTNGFKQSRAEFGDLYANAMQDTSRNAAGRGVEVVNVAQQFGQGSVEFTSSNLDLAISGQGFFVLNSPEGATSYTRAGAYSVDREGYVVNHSNDRLQVYQAVTGVGGSTTFNAGILQDLRLQTSTSTPAATSEVEALMNLNNSESAIAAATAFDPLDPTSFNNSTSTTVYDSLGGSHTATLYFRKNAANTWESHAYVDGVAAGGNPIAMTFDSATGALTSTAVNTITFTPTTGAAAQSLDIDFGGTTQFGAPFGVNNLSQDGYTSGRLAGVDIDTEGVVFARYTNGQSTALGKVALAKFNNDQGLRQMGDNIWAESYESGTAQLGEAGTSSFGQVQSGALESSNVDVAEQLVNLIMAQRNFQANAQVIQTSDQITQAIINLR